MDDDEEIEEQIERDIFTWLIEDDENKDELENKSRQRYNKDRATGHARVWADYFADDSVYPEFLFRP